ncbi:MAG TPA: 4Fe-4S binding protein [Firmicutes bacterium]|nr:4Fe-4S binding protein [Bacillota bacterium]
MIAALLEDKHLEELLRARVRQLLESGQISLFLGYERQESLPGILPSSVPCIIRDPSDVARLVFDRVCHRSLVKYLLDLPTGGDSKERRAGLVVRGCDSLALQRLIQDHRVSREEVYLLGIPCTGMVDKRKLSKVYPQSPSVSLESILDDTCLGCDTHNPVIYDELLCEKVSEAPSSVVDFVQVRRLEALSPDERYKVWEAEFSRCIRCFACRNVCPACDCRQCTLESNDPGWITKHTSISEQFMFHFIRAFHVAGRCVGCGECERVCPMGINIGELNRKFMKDIRELFGRDNPKMPRDVEPLGKFNPDDPEEFL